MQVSTRSLLTRKWSWHFWHKYSHRCFTFRSNVK